MLSDIIVAAIWTKFSMLLAVAVQGIPAAEAIPLEIDAPTRVSGRASDNSLIPFVVEYDNRQVGRRFFADGAEGAEIEEHAAVGIESDHAPVRQIQRHPQ